jgi:hypothetical protein
LKIFLRWVRAVSKAMLQFGRSGPKCFSCNEQAIAEHLLEPAGTDNTVSWLAFGVSECPQMTGRRPTAAEFALEIP